MRHTLQVKLLVFGVLCVALTVGSSAIQLLQFRDIAQKSDRVQAQYDVATDDSARLREEVIRLIARIKDVWLRGGKTDTVDSVADIVEQSWQVIAQYRMRLDTDVKPSDAMEQQLAMFDASMSDYRVNYLSALSTFKVQLTQPDAANADTRADAALRGMGLAASDLLGTYQNLIHQQTERVRADRRASIDTARDAALIEGSVLLLCIAAAGLWLVRSLGRGIGDVAAAAQAFGHGSREIRVRVRGKGELAQLGTAFNAMVAELATQEQQLEELRQIAVALTSATTEQEVCDIVVTRLAEKFGYHYVSVYLIRPSDPDNLYLISQRGYSTVIDPIPIYGTVTGRTVRERRSILVTDSRLDRDFIAAESQIISEACAPILTPDRVLGTLLLEEESVDRLSEADLNLITTLANNVSVALENVRLNVEARSRITSLASANRDLSAVTATGTRLASTLDLDAVYTLIADELSRVIDAPTLYITSYDEESDAITTQVVHSAGTPYASKNVPTRTSLSGWVITARRSVYLHTAEEAQQFFAAEGIATIGNSQQSVLGIPLIAGTRIVGTVTVGSPMQHAFNDQQVSVVQTIAAQAAIAINNALLYDQVQRQVGEMQHLNQELAKANALKSEFLATMSHELRTPLNAIIGFSELLADGIVSEPEEIHACLTDILNSGRHLLSLINDVLDISKIEAGHMELKRTRFDIREEVQEVARAVAPLINARQHTLFIEEPDQPVGVEADRQRIRQVILNLVSNAIKFTPDGGQITIGMGPDVDQKGCARVFVRDSGIGIRADDFGKLFEKFRQLDSSHNRRYEGTGLGLALTKQLVELNGGSITVTSVVNHGSTFAFTVPSSAVASAVPPPAKDSISAVAD